MSLAPPYRILLGSLSLLAGLLPAARGEACTSVLVGRGASADGSTMVTYAADSHELYGALYHLPAAVHAVGAQREIVEWDTGAFLGRIPEAAQTFAVVGNMNEHQVVIGETTFEARKELSPVPPAPGAPAPTIQSSGLDYGSLIYLALQRARTAREAIKVIDGLTAEYGYKSDGESFSIADPTETWLMEIVGKGAKAKGALWVARRVPDGMVTAHANNARIGTFPLNDPQNCLYAKDVVSFAREQGWFSGKDSEFSFARTYASVDPNTLRTCELRVWRVFSRLAPSLKLSSDWAMSVPGAAPLPLWVTPDKKIRPQDLMEVMRDHFEDTPFDLRRGVGAGPYALPYRWRPLTWKVEGATYLNDRAIATQQTGFVFVSQSRASLPGPIGGLLWFGVDDAASTVFMPVYAGIRQVPTALAESTATLHRFSWDSAFWVFNWVANQAYGRYADMIVDVRQVQQELEGGFLERQSAVEAAALQQYRTAPELGRDYLTDYTRRQVELTHARWRSLGENLLVKYMDGNVKDRTGKVLHPPYPEEWYRRIVAEDPPRYRLPEVPAKQAAP